MKSEKVKDRKRRTIIYQSAKESARAADKEFRDNLDLFEHILSAYERARARYTRILLSDGGGEGEALVLCRPP